MSDQLSVDSFLQSVRNWAQADHNLQSCNPENTESMELAKRMERQAALFVQTTLREFIEVATGQGTMAVDPYAPYILGPGRNEPRSLYPALGDAPIPVCTCTHRRDQHLKMRLKCDVLECACVEFVKDLHPAATKRA